MDDKYVPAVKSGRFLWLYDPLSRWTLREQTFKDRLIKEAHLEEAHPGCHRVLDLGCGTGTLALMVRSVCPGAEIVGLDGDMRILSIARAKALKSGVKILLYQGLAQALPHREGSFDYVFSTLVFHHLTRGQKIAALQEVIRVLRPGGELHVADWGKPQNLLMRTAFRLVEWSDGKERTSDNRAGLLPQFMVSAGFASVRETQQFTTFFGTLCLYHAQKPT